MIFRRITVLLLMTLLTAALPLMAEEEEKEEEEKEAVIISYYQIKPSLVANLASGGRYIRCDIQLMTKDDAFLEELKIHDPAIRHTLLLLLSEQDGMAIKKPDGKESLRKKALKQVNDLMKEQTGKAGLEALFFTTFFVQ